MATPPTMTTTTGDEPGALRPDLRVWLRRSPGGREAWALRFELTHGRAVLRVSRPGVLIVPPARTRGHEDQLDAAQLRTSVLMVVPDRGPRLPYRLSGLDDRFLLELEPECWTELDVEHPGEGAEGRILPARSSAIISLSGEVDPALPTLADLAHLASLVERRADRGPNERDADAPDPVDPPELIEVGEPDTAPSIAPPAAPPPAPPARSLRQRLAAAPPSFELQTSPPPVHRPPSPPPRAERPHATVHEPAEGGRYMARHLRRQLERRDQELDLLRARIAELEEALARRR